MNLPSSFDVILCEDFRQERASDKATIIGYYAGDDIVMDAQALNQHLPTLTYVVRLKDGSGEWSVSWNILGPSGQPLLPNNSEFRTGKKPGVYGLLIIRLNNHPVPEFGRYRLVFELEGKKKFEFPYEIKSG